MMIRSEDPKTKKVQEAAQAVEERRVDAESYWTCYCKENPRDPCCKIYEI